MDNKQMLDHLFRQQFGKMVSILVRIFGLQHMQLIEDAVQDTFVKALLAWRQKKPKNPEAWLMLAAKNRIIDILRKLTAEEKRAIKFSSGVSTIAVQEIFQEHEIQDSQLRMIFTACHPVLDSSEQIAFALKAISGFSTKEIATALLTKEETIKKRLSRARKRIVASEVKFQIPNPEEMVLRLPRVHEVIYLIFNEGFHSNSKKAVVREDLIVEALRLGQLVINSQISMHETSCALFALMCFHTARMESKVDSDNQIISLEHQDRSKWLNDYIILGNQHMNIAVETEAFSSYHYEAAIAAEHLKAASFELTDWPRILLWYNRLYAVHPTPFVAVNQAIVHLQLGNLDEGKSIIDRLEDTNLEQKSYLVNCVRAEYYHLLGVDQIAIEELSVAISKASNEAENAYLKRKLDHWRAD